MTERVDDLALNWDMTAFRIYDPALGRFHQVDPLTDLMPWINSYQYAYNNPIYFNDPLGLMSGGGGEGKAYDTEKGEDGWWRVKKSSNSSNNSGGGEEPTTNTWSPLQPGNLRNQAYKNLVDQRVGDRGIKFNQAVGGVFERGVGEAFFPLGRNNKNFPTKSRLTHGGVRPDFVQIVILAIQMNDGSGEMISYDNGHFNEVKSGYGPVTMDGSGDRQMKAMIDVLSNMKPRGGGGADIGGTALTIYTPAGVDISGALIDHAERNGVLLFQRQAYFNPANPTEIKFTYPYRLSHNPAIIFFQMILSMKIGDKLSPESGYLRWNNLTNSGNDPD